MESQQHAHTDATPAHPSKEAVREWLRQRCLRQEPLPEAEQIRRELWQVHSSRAS